MATGGHFESDIAENQWASFYPHTEIMCYWSLDLIFKDKLKIRNQKILYDQQAAILIVKSLNFYPYTSLLFCLSLGSIFKAKLKVEPGNRKNPIPAAILKVMFLEINRVLSVATLNIHMQTWIEIPKQTWLKLRKPCRLQTYRRTGGRTR